MSRANDRNGRRGWTNDPSERITVRPAVSEEIDEAFAVLGVARRRYLLYYLAGLQDSVTTLDRAATAVSELETPAGGTPDERLRDIVRISLAHNHLPRLEAADVVEYDQRSGDVRFLGTPELDTWLAQTRSLELF